MNLEEQVCSLELAKRLKELGVKQESLFYWHNDSGKDYPAYGDPSLCLCPYDSISAFTVAELGEMLPLLCWSSKDKKGQWVALDPIDMLKSRQYSQTEADARAKVLVYSIENGHLKVEDI